MDAKRQAEDPNRAAMCRALILTPPPTLSERRDRMFALWASIEAAKRRADQP